LVKVEEDAELGPPAPPGFEAPLLDLEAAGYTDLVC
jgi:hypothetical protein